MRAHTTAPTMIIVRLDDACRPRTSSSGRCAKARKLAVLALGSLSVSGMRATLAGQGLAAGEEGTN